MYVQDEFLSPTRSDRLNMDSISVDLLSHGRRLLAIRGLQSEVWARVLGNGLCAELAVSGIPRRKSSESLATLG